MPRFTYVQVAEVIAICRLGLTIVVDYTSDETLLAYAGARHTIRNGGRRKHEK